MHLQGGEWARSACVGRYTATCGVSMYGGRFMRSMIGTVCGLVSAGSTLWGTRHPENAIQSSGTATALDTRLPFARRGTARVAPASIPAPRGGFAAFAAPPCPRCVTFLSGFEGIIGARRKRFPTQLGLLFQVPEDGSRIDP